MFWIIKKFISKIKKNKELISIMLCYVFATYFKNLFIIINRIKIVNTIATNVDIPNEKLMQEYAFKKINITSSVKQNITIKIIITRIPNPQ